MRVTTELGSFDLNFDLPATRNQRRSGKMSGQLQPYHLNPQSANQGQLLTEVDCDVIIDNGDRLCVTYFPFGRTGSASGFIARVWNREV